MEEIYYRIEFEDSKDIDFSLREIVSPIRLEVGDKIALSNRSFDPDDKRISQSDICERVEILFKKSIKVSKNKAYFEIIDVAYSVEWYNGDDFSFYGVITLKGK